MTKEQVDLFNSALKGVIAVSKSNVDDIRTVITGTEKWLDENSILRESELYFTYSGYLQTVKRMVQEFEYINSKAKAP